MAAYVNTPSASEIEPIERTATSAASVADREYVRVVDATRKLDDPHSKESRNLTAKERFDEGRKLRDGGAAIIYAATGNLAAHREAIGRITESLDVRTIASRAEFLPIMTGNPESTAHDLRVIARNVLRREYVDRLGRMRSDELAAEARRILRDAGDRPDLTPELARLYELDAVVRALPSSPETVSAKSALIAAWSGIESQWRTRADLLDRVTRAGWHFDKADDLARALREGREPAASTKAREIAQAMVDAGKAA